MATGHDQLKSNRAAAGILCALIFAVAPHAGAAVVQIDSGVMEFNDGTLSPFDGPTAGLDLFESIFLPVAPAKLNALIAEPSDTRAPADARTENALTGKHMLPTLDSIIAEIDIDPLAGGPFAAEKYVSDETIGFPFDYGQAATASVMPASDVDCDSEEECPAVDTPVSVPDPSTVLLMVAGTLVILFTVRHGRHAPVRI